MDEELDNAMSLVQKWRKQSSALHVLNPKNDIDATTAATNVPDEKQRKETAIIVPINSRYSLLPPIERHCTTDKQDVNNTKSAIGYEILFEQFHNGVEIKKPIALPPIKWSERTLANCNMLLQKNYENLTSKQQQKALERKKKRTNTRYLRRENQCGGNWELAKAEKIRCNELNSYSQSLGLDKQLNQHKTPGERNKKKTNSVRTKH